MNRKSAKEKKEKQLDFGLKNPPQNIYYKYKDQYELWLSKLETYKFMKDLLMWFVVVISLSLIITQIYTIQSIDILPTKIPIFNYFFTLTFRLANTNWIYIYPALSSIVLITGLLFTNKYYHTERELSRTLLVSILLVTLSLSIILLKIVYTF